MMFATRTLLILLLIISNALPSDTLLFGDNTTATMDTDFKLLNSTMMVSTDMYGDIDIINTFCPEFCTCNKFPLKREASCVGEEIKTLEQIDFPENMKTLHLVGTAIESLSGKDIAKNLSEIVTLFIDHSKYLHTIESGTFDGLQDLQVLRIKDALKLTHLDSDVFGDLPALSYLNIKYCGLTTVPNLTNLVAHEDYFKKLDLSYNKISTIKPYTFKSLQSLYELDLSGNLIHYLPKHAFYGSTVHILNLGSNPMTKLDENVFLGIRGLKEIILSNTLITYLPTNGLKNIVVLDLQDTPTLKKFPPVFRFERIEVAKLYYFSHCCAFTYLVQENADYAKLHKIGNSVQTTDCPEASQTAGSPTVAGSPTPSVAVMDTGIVDESVAHRPNSETKKSLGSSDYYYSVWGDERSRSYGYDPIGGQFPSGVPAPIMTNPPGPTDSQDTWDGDHVIAPIDPNRSYLINGTRCNEFVPKNYKKVICTPKPDAFNPCSDVMGYIFLRIVVWFIAMTALAGNFLVLVVLLSYRHKMTVPKFLMCNLSFADLCMGVYLLMVASVDLHTLGEYFNFAITWQHEAGCKIAGFISIFSSELSVFTLTVLTIERWYTIIYAIDLNKRIRLRQAAKIIVGAWFFAIMIASLPILHVGSYGVTSMCIPFYVGGNDSPITYAYTLFILLFNALAFIIICSCYIKMYLTVHNPHTAMQRKDSKVAKRMAVLIFTDFVCWAPIAIFGLSAAFGKPLLSVNQSKILIVLFYPINSCANPFLYAIFTKAFRRDLVMMLAKHGMFEKQAMKYRGAHSGDIRSMSQANSYTSGRDGQHKCHYRGSSASVLTQITSDARSSVAMFEKDQIHYESPTKSPKQNHIAIPLMPLPDKTNIANAHPNNEPKKPLDTVTESDTVTTATNASANNNNKQPLMKKLSAVLHVDYTNSDLDTVLEERCEPGSSGLVLEVPEPHIQTYLRAPNARDFVDDDDDDDDEDDDCFENATEDELKDSDYERKNSRTDSGIQSNTTTPTDRTDISNKTRVLELIQHSEQTNESNL